MGNIGNLLFRDDLPYPYNLSEALTASTKVVHSENSMTYVEITPQAAERIVDGLSGRQRDIVLRIVKHGESVNTVANEYGVTRERIRQIAGRAAELMVLAAKSRDYAVVPAQMYDEERKAREKAETRLDALLGILNRTNDGRAEETFSDERDLLALPIEETNMSVRSINCLRRKGYKTLGDVLKIGSYEEMIGIRHLGRKSAEEICAYFHARGLSMPWEG